MINLPSIRPNNPLDLEHWCSVYCEVCHVHIENQCTQHIDYTVTVFFTHKSELI